MSSPRHATLPVFLALTAALALLPGRAQGQDQSQVQIPAPLTTLRSVSIDLPQGDRIFPPGPHVDAVNNNCLACHSAGMVLNQPDMSRAAWETEVNKMINVYKAPVAAEDVPAIVAYLDATKGTKPAEGTPQAR
jgi:hypothetical protein